jgi:type IV pilus assembly protein PilA
MDCSSLHIRSQGFTLIELLVAIGIIGILAAIAVQQYALYKAQGFDARAKTDLRNVASAEEAYFVDNETFLSCVDMDCADLLPGIVSLSDGVTVEVTAAAESFTATAEHPRGSGVVCQWDSSQEGFIGCD